MLAQIHIHGVINIDDVRCTKQMCMSGRIQIRIGYKTTALWLLD